MSDETVEQKRRRYRPQKVRVLLIGESAPANGTFFYRGDSSLARKAGIPQLVEAMRGLRPALIVVVMKAIEKDVAQAVREAGLGDVETRVLCFPARGHERKYVAGLTELISASTARGSHHAANQRIQGTARGLDKAFCRR